MASIRSRPPSFGVGLPHARLPPHAPSHAFALSLAHSFPRTLRSPSCTLTPLHSHASLFRTLPLHALFPAHALPHTLILSHACFPALPPSGHGIPEQKLNRAPLVAVKRELWTLFGFCGGPSAPAADLIRGSGGGASVGVVKRCGGVAVKTRPPLRRTTPCQGSTGESPLILSNSALKDLIRSVPSYNPGLP